MPFSLEQIAKWRSRLDPYLQTIPHNYDKVLLIDLCRLVVDANRFSPTFFSNVKNCRLGAIVRL